MNRRSFIGSITVALAALPFVGRSPAQKRIDDLQAEVDALVFDDSGRAGFHSWVKPDPHQVFGLFGKINAAPWKGHPPHTIRMSGASWSPKTGTFYHFQKLPGDGMAVGSWDGFSWSLAYKDLYRPCDFNLYDFGEQVA